MIRITILSILVLSGCSSNKYVDTRSIRTIATTTKIHGLKSAGYVSSKDCSWSLLGYSFGGGPSYGDAFNNAVSLKNTTFFKDVSDEFSSKTKLHKFRVKLLNNIQTSEEGWNAFIIGKKCVKLRAVAYY